MVKRYQKVCRTCEELYRTNQKYSIKCDKCKKIKSSFSKASIHKQEKKLERKKDKDWVKAIGVKYNRTCVVCGDANRPHTHHIIPRTFKETRWDEMNGIMLCAKCHKFGKYSAHKNALWFINWLAMNETNQYYYLTNKAEEIKNGTTN